MNAVAPIQIRPLERPTFDSSRISDFNEWCLDNASQLARYWAEQGQALGFGKDEDTDFDFWLRVQHEIECDYYFARHGGCES